MKPVPFLGALFLTCTFATLTPAQAPPTSSSGILYTATVKDAEAEVRSGPSSKPAMYPTNRLKQGAIVEVVKEVPGETDTERWLGIKPPPGSFSFINMRFLQRTAAQTWVVVAHDDVTVPVLIGSNQLPEATKPTVIGAQVGRGSLVVSGWKEITADDGMWLPIEPPPGEVRYVRSTAVTRNDPSTTTAAAPPPAGNPPAAPPVVSPVTYAPTPGTAASVQPPSAPAPTSPTSATPRTVDPMWDEAQKAERAGNYAEAERLYTNLAGNVIRTDHDLAMECYNRIHYMHQNNRGGTTTAYQPNGNTEARYASGTGDGRLSPVPAGTYVPQNNVCTSPCPPQTQQPNNVPGVANAMPRHSGPGYLRSAGRSVDGKPAYALLSSQNQLLMYIHPQTGTDLEPYLNRNVDVYGPLVYRMDLRTNYMVATQVTPLP
jgi:hypothetical protein